MASEYFFSNNPVDWTNLEGLYVSERKPPGSIRGVDLSTVGFAGRCVRGPLTPQEITSTARFIELYGERDVGTDGAALVGEVWAALLNKPFGKIVVRRVAAAAAVKATLTLSNAVPTAIIRVDAANPGVWGNGATGGITAAVEAATDANANHFNLRIKYLGRDYLYEDLNTFTSADNNLEAKLGDDAANLITLTKLADGRPINISDTNLATGADGTLAAGDYTAGITDIANYPGVAVCLVPEAGVTQSTLNATIVTLASTVKDRVFLTWSGVVSESVSANKTAFTAQITTRSDRIVWCYNTTQTLDAKTKLKINQAPHVWLASIMSQTHPSVHKGSQQTMQYLAGVVSVTNPLLTRQDLIDLRKHGITTIEQLANEGFKFRSVVTTSLTSGLTELSRRLMTDFIQLSAAERLKSFPKDKNTRVSRAMEISELKAFLKSLQEEGDGKTVDDDDPDLGPGFIIDKESVNTGASRGTGLERTLIRVRLVNHKLFLVLESEIGSGLLLELSA